MAQPNITIIQGQGLGLRANGEDHITGLLLVGGEEFSPSTPIFGANQFIYSAVNTASTCLLDAVSNVSIEAVATDYKLTLKGIDGVDTILEYKSTIGELHTAIVTVFTDKIHKDRKKHGYDAVSGIITGPKSFGLWLNGVTLSNNFNAFFTLDAFSGGTTDKNGVLKYQIDEYFRNNNLGQLWIKSVATTTVYDEIYNLQVLADGKLRQLIVLNLNSTSNRSIQLGLIQAQIDLLTTEKMPLEVIFGSAQTTFTEDLSQLSCKNVSVIVSKSTAGEGDKATKQTGKPIVGVGSFAGLLSKVAVNLKPCEVIDSLNVGSGLEFSTFSFADETTTKPVSELNDIHDRGFIYLRKFVGKQGAYFSNTNTAISETNDFSKIEKNRTANKVSRLLYIAYLPYLNSSILLNADGTIRQEVVETLQNVGKQALSEMLRVNELSAYDIVIDPNQLILSTNTLEIQASIVPTGTAEQIIILQSFKTSLV